MTHKETPGLRSTPNTGAKSPRVLFLSLRGDTLRLSWGFYNLWPYILLPWETVKTAAKLCSSAQSRNRVSTLHLLCTTKWIVPCAV